MAFLSEAQLETALLEQLGVLGYACASDDTIGPDGKHPERSAYDEVVLKARLTAAVARLNPALPPEAQADAIRRLIQSELPNLLEENRRIHRLLIEGSDVEYMLHESGTEDGTLTAGQLVAAKVRLIDFDNPASNDWLAVQQFTVIVGQIKRRPDVVLFVNGLPLAVVELKAPGGEHATLTGALNQLQTYKQQIPALFRSNALLVTSDGLSARVGSLSADFERFMPWRTTDGTRIEPKGLPEMATLIEGVFDHRRVLDLLRHFTVFAEWPDGLVKIIAGYHQFHAVKKAVISTLRASFSPLLQAGEELGVREDPAIYGLPSVKDQPPGDHKAGVIWHTQGSGKSLLMAFYAGLLVADPRMANPTLVVLTDRNDLDDQLFTTFSQCRDLLRQTPVQAQDREHLRTLLNRASGGVIFTTIQKFAPASLTPAPSPGGRGEQGMLTDRSNVVVIADEAHRSQYGFKAKVASQTGEIAYGFAKYLRDALPNASFIGFTGTPIEATDVNTPAVFGHYIDIYDISRAVEDGATVPIYYESRLARIELIDAEKPRIDAEIEALLEKVEIVRAMFHGFDYRTGLSGTPGERLAMMASAIEWILDKQQQWAAAEQTPAAKKQAQRRFADGVLALSKAFALAASSDEARGIREEVGFFQAIRAALVKTAGGSGAARQDRELAIQQIVSRAVVSTEIVDILAAAGIQTPDISILSDEFLLEVQQMEQKNLGLEALRKLLNDSIRSRTRTNVVETRAFTERLEDAVARYHANAITTAEVLQELIKLAQDIRAARSRGEEQGLSDEEIAFYDALAENESALQVMGDEKLRVIAHELLVSLRDNVAVDWAHRESARARLRVLVKRILRKYGYPPDLQDAAVQTVLQQAEALSSAWSLPMRGGS